MDIEVDTHINTIFVEDGCTFYGNEYDGTNSLITHPEFDELCRKFITQPNQCDLNWIYRHMYYLIEANEPIVRCILLFLREVIEHSSRIILDERNYAEVILSFIDEFVQVASELLEYSNETINNIKLPIKDILSDIFWYNADLKIKMESKIMKLIK